MARRRREATRAERSAAPVLRAPGMLAVAAGLAGASGLWALFQWMELVSARGGGEAFCALGDPATCAAVWDSAFAGAVHAWTGLPVAGWGLVWSAAAFAFPLAALARAAAGRDVEPFVSAARLAALGGVASVAVLLIASLAAGGICTSCAGTYALVLAYAFSCWLGTRGPALRLAAGVAWAAGATAAAFLVLLVPGLRTPRSAADGAALDLPRGAERGVVERGRESDGALADMIEGLSPQHRQALSDALALYSSSPASTREPRFVFGSEDAPVRITEFTDTLCSHCATLHASLKRLRAMAPDGALALEPRHFPLDGACNPRIGREAETPVRCEAARVRICMEGRPGAAALEDALYAHQRSLTVERVYDLADEYADRAELEACAASPETEAKLREDIAWATELGIRGTPLVLVNGRRGSAFAPFLTAMLLARGDDRHPAFDALPPPRLGRR